MFASVSVGNVGNFSHILPIPTEDKQMPWYKTEYEVKEFRRFAVVFALPLKGHLPSMPLRFISLVLQIKRMGLIQFGYVPSTQISTN